MDKVLLVGTGNIAHDYVKVLRGLHADFDVIGRSAEGCAAFSGEMELDARPGGLERYKDELGQYKAAILAIDASQLPAAASLLLEQGVKDVLVEKPVGLTADDVRRVVRTAETTGGRACVGYNRRFYASVRRAEQIIAGDGGVRSFHFEFTEWPHTVLAAGLPEETIQNWFLCNSSHVVDMAFYLGGQPKNIYCFTAGGTDWTREKTVYAGAGVTEKGALFDYCANWGAPGRWSVEVMTERHRLIFRPLEKLQIQELKSVRIDFAEDVDYTLDTEYKPGLYGEVSVLLGLAEQDRGRMKTAAQQLEMFPLFEKIAGRRY